MGWDMEPKIVFLEPLGGLYNTFVGRCGLDLLLRYIVSVGSTTYCRIIPNDKDLRTSLTCL